MDITEDLIEKINKTLPKISNTSPIDRIISDPMSCGSKRRVKSKVQSTLGGFHSSYRHRKFEKFRAPSLSSNADKSIMKELQSKTFYYQPGMVLNKNIDYMNSVKSNDNLITDRTNNTLKIQPIEIRPLHFNGHNSKLEKDKSVRIIDQPRTAQKFYMNPNYTQNNFSTIYGIKSNEAITVKSRNYDSSRIRSLDNKHTYKEDHDSIYNLARKCESNFVDAHNYMSDVKCRQTILDLKHREFLGTVNIFQEIENADISVLKLMYEYKVDAKLQDLHTANDVIKEYKSGITDPSRYVAKLERNIKQRIMKRKKKTWQ